MLLTTHKFYKYTVHLGNRIASVFSFKVKRAIDWWGECIRLHPERRCLYGLTPPGLPKLDIDNCINRNNASSYIGKCHDNFHWLNNSAARLRVGLYGLFLTDWLEVFPREQMFFVKFEEYKTNTFDIVQNGIYPFLDIPQLSQDRVDLLQKKISKSTPSWASKKILEVFQETQDMLKTFYEPYNRRLRDLLDDDKWLWNDTLS